MQVLIYDSDCFMCNNFIRFIIKINKNPTLYITDFNSIWTLKNTQKNPDIDSMIFIDKSKKYIYSDSIIHLLVASNYFFKPLLAIKLIPKPLRDKVYKRFAKNRKKVFKSKHCPIPSDKARKMFLY